LQKHFKPSRLQTKEAKHENFSIQRKSAQTSGALQSSSESRQIPVCLSQLAIDPKEGKIATQDITLQTRQAMNNIKAILEAAGYGLEDIVQSTVYLSSMALFEEFNVEYAKFFSAEFPTRATVASGLKTGAFVEISVVAYKE
jgi:2-iminobutanoate/2-iminopropanoate deaminase